MSNMSSAILSRACACRHAVPPPPPSRTKWTRLVHPSVLTGHVSSLAGTLYRLHKLDPEDYDTLITSTTKHAARLLKKPDQCRAVYVCSHLFWNDALRQPAEEGAEQGELAFHDGKRVLDCLQRSLKIADVCMQAASSVHLFVEILNRYLFYFEADNDKVTVKYLQGLVDLVKENLATLQARAPSRAARPRCLFAVLLALARDCCR